MVTAEVSVQRETVNPSHLSQTLDRLLKKYIADTANTNTKNAKRGRHRNHHRQNDMDDCKKTWVILDIDKTVITSDEDLMDPALPGLLEKIEKGKYPGVRFVFLTARPCGDNSTGHTIEMLRSEFNLMNEDRSHCRRLAPTSQNTCVCTSSQVRVMFTGGLSKGVAINNWFKLPEHASYVVNHIIFADDQEGYLNSVEMHTKLGSMLEKMTLLKMDYRNRIKTFLQNLVYF
jgi:hypothetical protein